MKVTIEFYMFKLILVLNFSFNKQFWFFGGNFPKRILVVKNRKNEHNHSILHIWISLGIKVDFEQLVLTFWTKFDQKGYIELKKKRRSEHHHWIPYLWISLSNKFQDKLTILIFLEQICLERVFLSQTKKMISWIRFAQKGIFSLKQKK